jgi:signal transduction histidine kinase
MNVDFLRHVSLFADLPEADLERLCARTQEVTLQKGEQLFSEGSAGDQAYVIKEGELEIHKASGGRDILLDIRKPGDVIGEIALLENTTRMAGVVAHTDVVLIEVHKDQLEELLKRSPSAGQILFRTILSRWRRTEAMLRERDKLAQLGTLTAGITHELNNPAAAVRRGAEHLQLTLQQFHEALEEIQHMSLDEGAYRGLMELAERVRNQPSLELDGLARSDREQELEEALEERGVEDAWELAPILADIDLDIIPELTKLFSADRLGPVVRWIGTEQAMHSLLSELVQGATRISEIIKALKSYVYLDQAPVQNVDVHEGLNNTLLILRSKLKAGISVERDYAQDLPFIQAYGSELNQVWTNLIDNAADALAAQLEQHQPAVIKLRTRREGDFVAVEVEDNGPGIPEELQGQIFELFFTTKPQGQGTGMGLDISYNIVVMKHGGEIKLDSQPGRTVFQVLLPIQKDTQSEK